MLRRRAILVALFTIASLVSPLTAARSAVTGEIKAMSHNHPRGKNFSWIAARIDASNGASVNAHLVGPAVASTASLDCTARRANDGKLLAVWKIKQRGDYTVHLTVSKSGDSASDSADYTVPSSPRWGPFKFKKDAGCHQGWPRP